MDQAQEQSLDVNSAAAELASLDIDFGGDDAEEKDQSAPEESEGADESQDDSADEAESVSDEEEAEETDEGSEEEGTAIESLADLAQALGKSVEDVEDTLTTTVKINGEEQQVTLKELKNGFQMSRDYTLKTQQLADERRRFDESRQQEVAEIQKQHQIASNLFSQIRNAFIGQINSAQLEKLKAENPAQYDAIRWEIQDRIQAFDALAQQGALAWAEIENKQSTEKQQKLSTYAQGEREKLLAAVPEWTEAEGKKIGEYLSSAYGFAPEQLSNIYDHRELVIARKAMLYDQMKQQASTVTKKVKQLPKLVKSGPKQKALNVSSDRIATAKRRLSQTGNVKDAAAAIELLM